MLIAGIPWGTEGSARRDARFAEWLRSQGQPGIPTSDAYRSVTVSTHGDRQLFESEIVGCQVRAVVVDGEIRGWTSPESEARQLREAARRARDEADRLERVAAALVAEIEQARG